MKLEHHAYLIISAEETTLIADLKKDYPEANHQKFERLGIEDSRALALDQSQTNWHGHKKIFILEINDATIEAQNALLKMLEEPTAETHFFLIVPNAEILLPTVRSRLQTLRVTLKDPRCDLNTQTAQEFLALIPAKRLEWLKNTDLPNNFLDQLEVAMFKPQGRTLKTQNSRCDLKSWPDLTLARRHWRTPGASHKLLLEHLAVSC
ncbi:MAG: hypothetical protein AAB589_02150 [Patescibacteria group bacterium]